MPLPLNEDGSVADSWQDLFNRDIYLNTVENYLSEAKERNMASMFYNLFLAFGILKPATEFQINGCFTKTGCTRMSTNTGWEILGIF